MNPTPTDTTTPVRRIASVDGPDPIDKHVGERVRLRRAMLGMSQDTMSRALGVSFQQVQKYERGTNRISASRLFDVARVLNVPIGFFFEAMGEDALSARDTEVGRAGLPQPVEANASPISTEAMALLADWGRLREHQQRAIRAVIDATLSTTAATPAEPLAAA
ncbi:helix-turn-helix transcriptional regulator [Roseospira marina]|uniref:Helix-turn-helix transcriptional regulator n=1 Tax=Roseospira marina TaxID=140057 RepID=A0A5M6IB40_9PROT|nr:helix-turn-helix transcriptional regulator [Roseospira marina]KAA5605451.1 helix-turn-helix transcriptional regulator [Roseospira marina]MBB4314549.1 transcriptional regulator with XRE-family HTH domain [Roseospira marina]MBB5088889.1 transcriptional regulator with XRE-family HTH domain [Roseospira marina]